MFRKPFESSFLIKNEPKKNPYFSSSFDVSSIDDEQAKPMTRAERIASALSQHVEKGNKYETMLEEGPLKPKVSTGRRIAAVLAGGLAGASNPSLGIQVGEMIAGAPKRKAEEDFTRDLSLAERAANQERSRLQDALNIVDAETEQERYNTDLKFKEDEAKLTAEKHASDMANAEIRRLIDTKSLNLMGKDIRISDGHAWIINLDTGEKEDLGAIGKTPEEMNELQANLVRLQGRISRDNTLASIDAQADRDEKRIGRQEDKELTVLRERMRLQAEAAQNKLKAVLEKEDADESAKKIALELYRAVAAEPELAGYYQLDPVLGMPIIESDSFMDSARDKANKAKLRQILNNITRGVGGPMPELNNEILESLFPNPGGGGR